MRNQSMKEADRVLGRMEEFQEWCKAELERIHFHLKGLTKEVEGINKTRWIFYGQAGIVYALLMMLMEYFLHKFVFVGG